MFRSSPGSKVTVAPTVVVTEEPTDFVEPSPSSSESAAEQFDFAQMEKSFAALQHSLHGPAGFAIASNGRVWSTGKKQIDFAWSTSKIPVTIAALKVDKSEHMIMRAHDAITISSNSEAHAMWEMLGGYEKSAAAVTEVLRAGGDNNTVVNYEDNNFGLTPWANSDAAIFADHLPCMDDALNVYSLMGAVHESHRWGLGTIKGVHFKGGWGPVDTGYIVRQMAVIPAGDGQFFGISIMVESKSGQIRGQDDLTTIANWLKKYISQIPAHSCQ